MRKDLGGFSMKEPCQYDSEDETCLSIEHANKKTEEALKKLSIKDSDTATTNNTAADSSTCSNQTAAANKDSTPP